MNKVALLLITNEKNDFLLFKRADNETTNASMYGLLGGGVEPNENPDKAIKREVMEESNVELGKHKFLGNYLEGRNMIYLYHTNDFNINNIKLNEEHSSFKWFTLDEIMSDKSVLHTNRKFASDYIKKHTIKEVISSMKRLIN